MTRTAVPFYKGTWHHPPGRHSKGDCADNPTELISAAPKPWAVDMFSGAGGMSLGLQRAGFTIVAAADSDPASMETHQINIGGVHYQGDLQEPGQFLRFLDNHGINEVELVAGGPPCQPFSRAGASKIKDLVHTGQRDIHDVRSELWRSLIQVVEGLNPRLVLFENVPDFARWNDGLLIAELLGTMKDLGYSVDARILEGFRFGVPQHRSRLFVVGSKLGPFAWPLPERSVVVLSDAISDLPTVPPAQREFVLPYSGPKTALQRKLRKGMRSDERTLIYDHVTRDVRADDAEIYSLMRPGETYRDIPETMRRYRVDIFDDKYRRLRWDELSRTITAHIAKDGYWYIHPSQNRTLSIREAARIQTFPDWFRFAGFPSLQYRQIGNAVPPLLAERIGKQLFRLTEDPKLDNKSALGIPARLMTWYAGQKKTHWRDAIGDPWQAIIGELLFERTIGEPFAIFRQVKSLAPTPEKLLVNRHQFAAIAGGSKYRRRFSIVVDVARDLKILFDGDVPSDELLLRTLPHIGEQRAAAVRLYGFGLPVVVLTAGALRIAARISGSPSLPRWQARIELLKLTGDNGPDQSFNRAIELLSHSACLPIDPRCAKCPLAEICLQKNNFIDASL